ncbi:MAG TPA: thermonuclease family protein [Actinomycetota bacterium]|jgi:micrococcal nuclease|nr:thermonuclease family protein [Actinomycetota bacterium]
MGAWADRRQRLGPRPVRNSRPVRSLLLVVLAVVLVAGCEGLVEGIGGGGNGRGGAARAPADLTTTKAERASWPSAPKDAVPAKVQRVSDGDTFVATVKGRRERIRVIGVDTPESVSPNQPDEPYGEEASDFAKHYLDGETVRLAGDAEPRDRYGRMLAYVWLEDGTFWNALLVAEGYAQQLTVPPNVTYERLFRRLVSEARREDRGLWAQERQGSS